MPIKGLEHLFGKTRNPKTGEVYAKAEVACVLMRPRDVRQFGNQADVANE
jgi:hypothetical protein